MPELQKTGHDSRIDKAIHFMRYNIEESISLEDIATAAGASKYHFQRLFKQSTGYSPHQFLRSIRLKRACYRLAFNPDVKIIDIAFDAGFETPEAFARYFKREFNCSPTSFRMQPNWLDLFVKTFSHNFLEEKAMHVEITTFEETPVAVLEHRGAPYRVLESASRFIEWRKANRLSPSTSRTFNIFYDDPELVSARDYRMDICAQIKNKEVAENDFGVVKKVIPSCRCAKTRHIGTWESLGIVVRGLCEDWLPKNGYIYGAFPIFVERVNLFPDTPEHDLITDIYVPIAKAA